MIMSSKIWSAMHCFFDSYLLYIRCKTTERWNHLIFVLGLDSSTKCFKFMPLNIVADPVVNNSVHKVFESRFKRENKRCVMKFKGFE